MAIKTQQKKVKKIARLPVAIHPKTKSKRIVVEVDAGRFERIASELGLFQEEFLDSLARSEHEIKQKKARRLKNLKNLRSA